MRFDKTKKEVLAMSKRLDTGNILKEIRPDKLALTEDIQTMLSFPGLLTFTDDFSIKDLGRGMLNHDLFCLVEALTTFENDLEGTSKAKVHTSNLSDLMLS